MNRFLDDESNDVPIDAPATELVPLDSDDLAQVYGGVFDDDFPCGTVN